MLSIEASGGYPAPAPSLLEEFQEALNMKMPPSYIEFLSRYNGAVPKSLRFSSDGKTWEIERFTFLRLEPTSDRLKKVDIEKVIGWNWDEMATLRDGEPPEESLLQLLPIALLPDDDYVCLDYRTNPENPEVCVWIRAQSSDFRPATTAVARTFDDFLLLLG